MKKKVSVILLGAIVLSLMFSGCIGQPPSPFPAPTPISPTYSTLPPTPTIHPAPKPPKRPLTPLTPKPTVTKMEFKGDIYVAIVMHSEDPHHKEYPDFRRDQSAYKEYREGLLRFAQMLHSYNLTFDFQPDWNFLEGARKWEDPELMSSTKNMNIIKYLQEELGVEIDPHSHENEGYNYADVAYLIQLLGATPSTVVGGHIYDPQSPAYQNWPRFEEALEGSKYPEARWKANILWGESSLHHVDDPIVSGVWKPKNPYNFFEHDEKGKLVTIGGYKRNLQGVKELVSKYLNGQIDKGKIYTATVFVGHSSMVREESRKRFEISIINELKELEREGLICITTLEKIAETWREKYMEKPNIYIEYLPK